MARWIDRKKAASQRRSPGVTPESEVDAMRVQSRARQDALSHGEEVPHHDEMFDAKALKAVAKKVKKQRSAVKEAEKQAKADAVDYSKDFDQESHHDRRDFGKHLKPKGKRVAKKGVDVGKEVPVPDAKKG